MVDHPRNRSRVVISVVPDMLMGTRIAVTAKQLGIDLVAALPEHAAEATRGAAADLVVVDLESLDDPAAWIRGLKQDPALRATRLLAFYPHVRNELREAAIASGADQVLPRSAFHRKLAELLAGEGHTPP